MSEGLVRLIEHLAWADGEIIQSLKERAAPPPRALQIISHVIAAEKVWLSRIAGRPGQAPPIWPDLSLDECRSLGVDNAANLRRLVDPAEPRQLERIISYANSRGEQFRTALEDILLHVCMHGSYHRGQIAALVRSTGGVPINTDYITYVRLQGGLKA